MKHNARNQIIVKFTLMIATVVMLLLIPVACADANVNITLTFDENLEQGSKTTCEVKNPQDFSLPSNPVRENYIFDGWYLDNGSWEEPFTVNSLLDLQISEDMSLTVYAKWLGEPYTVRFDCTNADDPIDPITVRYGEDYQLPVPAWGEEAFLGWEYDADPSVLLTDSKGSAISAFEFTEDITVFPLWKEGRVTLTFDSETDTYEQKSVWLGEAIGSLPVPQKTDHLFIGWFTHLNGEGSKITEETISEFTDDTTLYAYWKTEFCSISFDGNGATSGSVSILKAEHGSFVTLPDCSFYKSGYHFIGWELDGKIYQQGATYSDTAGDAMQFKALWSPNTCTVEFDGNNGAYGTMDSITVTYGENTTLPALKFTKEGYTFLGWKYDEKTLADQSDISDLLSVNGKSLTLIAQWKPITYIIQFDSNGADKGIMYDIRCLRDEAITLPKSQFKKEGHTFKGWTDSSGNFYDDNSTRTNWGMLVEEGAVYTLTAVWERNSYSVLLHGQGDIPAVKRITALYGDTVTLPECTFVKTGYQFDYWYRYIDYTENKYESGSTIQITEDLDLYAKWEPITYTLHFDANGGEGSMNDVNLTFEEYASLPNANFTKEGYRFGGFSLNGKFYKDGAYVGKLTSKEETLTLTAVWEYLYEGDGTEKSPYLVSSPEAFLAIPDFLYLDRNATYSKDGKIWFRLTQDIELNGSEVASFGNFAGALDGGGHTVSDFCIKNASGLIDQNRGVIRDLHISDVSLTLETNNYVDNVGILAGCNYGTITGCSVSDARMTVVNYNEYIFVGGLVGYAVHSNIINSRFIGNIDLISDHGDVTIGGIAGRMSCSYIISCYSILDAEVDTDFDSQSDIMNIGALVGQIDVYPVIRGGFGKITADVTVTNADAASSIILGGCIGTANYTPISCYASADSVLTVNGSTVEAADISAVPQVSDSDLRSMAWVAEKLPCFQNNGWSMAEGEYPLYTEAEQPSEAISTKEELLALSGKVLYGSYLLTADIDLTGEEWVPPILFGNFDGDGHKITGLSLTVAADGYAGLFSQNYGTIRNLLLKNYDIEILALTSVTVGGIVGQNFGTIHACHVDATMRITCRDGIANLGGIAGEILGGLISDCYVTADLTATGAAGSQVAGIAATVAYPQYVQRCYSDGSLTFNSPQMSVHTAHIYGIAQKATNSFSLAFLTMEDVYYTANKCYTTSSQVLGSSVNCYGCTLQSSIQQSSMKIKSLAELISVSFLQSELGFEQFTSEEALEESPDAVWVYDGSNLPKLWFE